MGGDWAGHYVNPYSDRVEGPIFKVSARLVEKDGSFDGTMVDLEPVYEIPLKSYLLQLEVAEQQRARAYLERLKNVSIRMSLPDRSRLSGRWSSGSVEFEKTYGGPQTVEWLADGQVVETQKVENHRVQYEGRLDGSGQVLDGKWSIRAPGFAGMIGKTLGEGTFHLVRQSS